MIWGVNGGLKWWNSEKEKKTVATDKTESN